MADLIIVGAGTAGCVLAERLTSSGKLKVLLLEAGGDASSRFVKIPAGFPRLFKSKFDWAFESEPQQAAHGRRIFTPRGKMLGGSSNMNAQIHQWCHPVDFAQWVDAGATGWSWEDVAPVFRRQERWLGDDPEQLRGRDGPMIVTPNRNAHRLSHAFVQAARSAGLGHQTYYNGGAYEGAWLAELAHKGGRRFSAFDAYLKPALGRSNLEVSRETLAVRINVENGRAVGVTARRGDREHTFGAPRVVLAGGVFGSPQLLMLSGIGPRAALSRLGIEVVHDAPDVGENLQDHPLAVLTFRTRGTDTLKSAETVPNLLRFLLSGRGMLASNVAEAFAFARSGVSAEAAPDIELLFGPVEWRKEGLELPKVDGFTIGAVILAPRSRGRVTLRSTNPQDPPLFDPGLLGDDGGHDRATLMAGVQIARKVAATRPLADYADGEMYPGPDVTPDKLLDVLGQQLQMLYHPTSTCRMGSDARSVVDPQLKVRGIEGLWIADASVMPTVPRGHPNAAVAMIAHRAADWISG